MKVRSTISQVSEQRLGPPAGAIDDGLTPDPEDVREANNYVSDALTAAMAERPVETPFTRPYGCSVTYPD